MLPPGSSAGPGAVGGAIKSAFKERRRSGRADKVNISLDCAFHCIAFHWILIQSYEQLARGEEEEEEVEVD